MISNEVDRKKFKDALQEIANSKTRIAAENDFIKEVVADLAESFELPKKTVSKLANIYYKQNMATEAAQFDELETLYEEIVNLTK
jgi:regulator of replication initiation timing